MKTYLKPEVYEKLAMEYALGTMTQRVRKRFETLMAKHPYIEVVVDEYQHRLGHLVEHLPEEKPHQRVWNSIESALDAEVVTAKETQLEPKSGGSSWWNFFSMKTMGVAFSVLLAVVIAIPLMSSKDVVMISSELTSTNNEPMVEVVARKSDMMLEVKMMDDIKVPEGMRLALWCYPKKQGEKPMDMGTLASKGATEMEIDKKVWKGLQEASRFVVSFEPMESKADAPTGQALFKGKLQMLTKA